MRAKSKLNSIETLMSQALIDLEISHEEFKQIVNEKERYDQMKESIRNKKDKEDFSENAYMYCKMVAITVEKYANAGVHTITVENKKSFWVKMIDVQKELGLKNMPDLIKKEICGIFETKKPTEKQKRKYVRTESEITKKPADDSKYKYARKDLMEK